MMSERETKIFISRDPNIIAKRVLGEDATVEDLKNIPSLMSYLKSHYSPEEVRAMVKEVQEPWVAGKKKTRKNFLNNNYIFHKIFELLEEDSKWYINDDGELGQGVYRLNENKLDIMMCSEIAKRNDTIRVKDGCFPVGSVLGHRIYCVEHINTGHSLYITLGEITR